MSGLNYYLTAKNSEQNLRLYIEKQRDGEVTITICGKHEGKDLQIDMDALSTLEATELGHFLINRAGGDPTV